MKEIVQSGLTPTVQPHNEESRKPRLSTCILNIFKNRQYRVPFHNKEYSNKNKKQGIDVDTALNQVETEDQSVVLNVQKGIQSRFYNSGRYSPQHERGLHHFHLLLSKYLT